MRTRIDFIIGIDPDTDKSGVARLDVATHMLEISSLPFPALLDYLMLQKEIEREKGCRIVVVVEASWRISTNWHTRRADSLRAAARKGKDAGRCHEVGRKIVECARHYGLEVVEQLPLKKIWKGNDGKITHDELSAFVPGLPSRTNQEERDAMLLAWNHAGFPIRMARPLK